MTLISVQKVSREYNLGRADALKALDDVSLDIDSGQVAVLKGPSGSGKTSLLSLIGCMARPTEGKILIDNKDVVKLPERFLTNIRRRKFGFIFQQFHLIKELTVLENVLLPLYPLDIGIRRMKAKASPLLEKLRIDGKEKLQIKKLSGGEQQRVAIARALINEPQVVIADEPTAHLDRKLAKEFMDTLGMLHAEGKTLVIATHDPFIHEHALVDRIIGMRDGRVVEVDTK